MMKIVLMATFSLAQALGPSFAYVGDWGWPGYPAEGKTAQGMAKIAKQLNIDSVLLLGDNYYDYGIDPEQGTDDSQFKNTFEDVYTTKLFGDLVFHVIAGNHDHLGDVQAEIDYSTLSKHWSFPSKYYSLNWNWTSTSGEARSLQIVMLDTVDLAGVSGSGRPSGSASGPSNETCAADQWTWLEQQLAASTADYLWVAGHYGIYSAGDDGTTQELVHKLLPKLKKYGAHYICGHDHLAQHLNMGGVHQFQNGMGMECCYGTGSMDTVPKGYIQYIISGHHAQGKHIGGHKPPRTIGGFNTMEFGDEAVTITTHKEDGVKLYSAQVPRRSSMFV